MAKIDKATKIKRISIGLIIIADIIFLPWILKFPFFIIDDFVTAPEKWINYGVLRSMKDIFIDHQFRKLFLAFQPLLVAIIIGITWNVNKFKKSNRIKEGVGGPEPSGEGQHGTSRWQNEKEMDDIPTVWYTDEPLKAGGIIYGMEKLKNKEKFWIDAEDVHTLIVGTTRSGKSRKINLPFIWELAKSEESMIIGDPKGELYIYTKDYLAKEGYNVIALNLREPLKGNQWNMLDLVNEAVDNGDISKATELAWDIANTITTQKPSSSSEPIWENGEESTIAALILLTVLESEFKFQRHMATAYYLLAEYGQQLEDGTIPLLDYIKNLPVQHPAKSAFATANIAPYRTRASFFTQALSDLRLFADSNIADMTNKQDHNFEKIGIDKTAVFLIVPDEKSTRNVLATLYVDQAYQSLVTLANKRGGRIPRRVNINLDEFGNLPAFPNFDKKLTVGGGRGIRFTLSVQDFAQLDELYNKKAKTIRGNCHNWIYLLTADMETAELISKKTGKYTIETESSSSSINQKSHSFGMNVSTTGRAVVMSDEVLRWPSDEALVLKVRQFPARYPLPDLSVYKANEDFGFVCTGDIDVDKEENRKIIEDRWNNITPREIENVSIWLPEIEIEEDDDNENDIGQDESVWLSLSPTEDIAEDEECSEEENINIDNIESATMDETNLNDILKMANVNSGDNSTEEDEDFL